MSGDAYWFGFDAYRRGEPHNPRNSTDWKRGYAWSRQMAEDDKSARDDDAWMIDPDMEAKG